MTEPTKDWIIFFSYLPLTLDRANLTALLALTIPSLEILPLKDGLRTELSIKICFNSETERSGLIDKMSAAIPLTMGAELEVPPCLE